MSSAAKTHNAGRPNWLELKDKYLKPEELLEELGFGEVIPVPIISVAQELGATVYYADDVQWAGAVEASVETGEANIYVHERDVQTRQRFTIAHEVAHLILHVDDMGGEGKWSVAARDHNLIPHNDQEKQANGYAAKLLMPRPRVRSLVNQWGLQVGRLAEAFEVSSAAMEIHLDNMGYL